MPWGERKATHYGAEGFAWTGSFVTSVTFIAGLVALPEQ